MCWGGPSLILPWVPLITSTVSVLEPSQNCLGHSNELIFLNRFAFSTLFIKLSERSQWSMPDLHTFLGGTLLIIVTHLRTSYFLHANSSYPHAIKSYARITWKAKAWTWRNMFASLSSALLILDPYIERAHFYFHYVKTSRAYTWLLEGAERIYPALWISILGAN